AFTIHYSQFSLHPSYFTLHTSFTSAIGYGRAIVRTEAWRSDPVTGTVIRRERNMASCWVREMVGRKQMQERSTSGETVVITGALSYTGRYTTKLLLNHGYRVRTLTYHPERANPFG